MNGGNYRSKGDLSDELVMFRGQKYLLRVVLRPNHYNGRACRARILRVDTKRRAHRYDQQHFRDSCCFHARGKHPLHKSKMNGSCTYPALQILLPPRTMVYNAFPLIHLDTMVSASAGLSCGTWRDK